MTVRSTTQVHFGEGDVSHRHAAAYSTLEFASSGNETYVHFETPAQIDEVIAELVALRAEMTAGRCPSVAEHSGRQCTEAGEHDRHRNGMVVWGPGVTEPEAQECTDYDPAYKLHGCELDAGHDGPHRDLLGNEWRESLQAPCPSVSSLGYGCTLHFGHHPARHRDADGDEWTDAVYDASGPRKPQVAAVAS